MSGKKYFICFVLLVIAVLLNLPMSASLRIKAGSRDNLAPFQNMMSFLIIKASETVSSFVNAGDILDEKQRMIEEIATLRHRVWSLKTLERDYEDLRRQLGFTTWQQDKLVLCEVVARGDTSGWWQTIRINKGTDDGVGPNMAVITTEGLIGRTTKEISRHTCEVLLIMDQMSRVACKFLRTGGFGIVSGTGVKIAGDIKLEMLYAVQPCFMEYISKTEKILGGDEVVTSGLGGVYPEGLLLGRVAKFSLDPSGLYQRADIVPAADIGTVRYVFVVVKQGDDR